VLPLIYITSLYLFCIATVIATGIHVLRSNYKSTSNQAYFAFSIASVIWMLALYVGGYFAPIGYSVIDATKAIFFFRIAWATPGIMLPALFLFFYNFPKEIKPLSRKIKYLIFTAALAFIGVSLTSLIHKSLIIENGIYIADEFGKLYLPYFIVFQGSLLGIFGLALYKLHKTRGVERKKLLLATIGFSFFEFFPLATNVLLPLFGIYIFQNEAVVFTLFFSTPTFYSILRYRFLDTKLVISKTLKRVTALSTAFGLGILIYKIFTIFVKEVEFIYVYSIIFLVALLAYSQIRNLFNSAKFHSFFGITSVENFNQNIKEFRDKNIIYSNLRDFEKDLAKTFCQRLKISFARFVLLNEINQKKYAALMQYFRNHKEILVTKEIQALREDDSRKNYDFYNELKELGEVCLPLFNPNKDLMGFFVLGKKQFDDIYSKEEIEALEKSAAFLNLKLTNTIFGNALNKEVKRKTLSLQQQNRRIRELLSQQADFISASAHELRTPLNIALLQIEMLENSFEEGDEKEDVKTALNAMEKLHALVNKLFSVQKYDFNKAELKLQKMDFGKFLEEIYKNFLPLTKEKPLRMKFENKLQKQTWLQIDPLQIQQVFHNLLSNAIKFTPIKGEVILRVEEANNRIKVCIADNGLGIPDKQKKMVFEKFKGGVNSKEGGIGLGLYICKKILELHKGKIWVEDTPQGGSSFCVELLK
jgi:nitrogen-specific signal transduction histidine kinase